MTTKKLLKFLPLFAIFLSACAQTQSPLTYETVYKKELGISFERPEKWTKEQLSPGDRYADYLIFIPNDKAPENDLQGKIAMSMVAAKNDELLNLDEEVVTFRNLFKAGKGFNVVSEKDTTLFGEKAREITFTFQNPEANKITEEIRATVTIYGNRAYAIFLDEETDEFEKYLPVYEKIVTTAKIANE